MSAGGRTRLPTWVTRMRFSAAIAAPPARFPCSPRFKIAVLSAREDCLAARRDCQSVGIVAHTKVLIAAGCAGERRTRPHKKEARGNQQSGRTQAERPVNADDAAADADGK